MGASNIAATIGPAICGRCYEVSEDVYSEVTSVFPLAASRTLNDTFALDLPKALRGVLESLSIEIRDEFVCTVESSDHFSYRRDGVTGRQAGFITL
jgi:copper oxidase (laccase) domain-containing protein